MSFVQEQLYTYTVIFKNWFNETALEPDHLWTCSHIDDDDDDDDWRLKCWPMNWWADELMIISQVVKSMVTC